MRRAFLLKNRLSCKPVFPPLSDCLPCAVRGLYSWVPRKKSMWHMTWPLEILLCVAASLSFTF